MIGTGFAVALKAVISLIKNKRTGEKREKSGNKLPVFILVLLSVILLSVFTDLTFIESVLTVIGAAGATYLSSMLTGQTGINPMEVFAILVLLLVRFLCNTGTTAAFTVAATVAVACGLGGDVMNDFKSGSLIGNNPRSQVMAEAIGGIIGAIVASSVFFLMKDIFVFGSPEMPAPQATAVAALSGGLENPVAFFIGIAIGLALQLLSIPATALGLGMYLGTYITVAVGLGALISFILKKLNFPKEKENLISSGLLGGEGCAGVIIAFITIFRS